MNYRAIESEITLYRILILFSHIPLLSIAYKYYSSYADRMGWSLSLYEFSEDYGNCMTSSWMMRHVCMAAYYRNWISIFIYCSTGILCKPTLRDSCGHCHHFYTFLCLWGTLKKISSLASDSSSDCILCDAYDRFSASKGYEIGSGVSLFFYQRPHASISCMEW